MAEHTKSQQDKTANRRPAPRPAHDAHDAQGASEHPLLALQQLAGNRAVQRLVADADGDSGEQRTSTQRAPARPVVAQPTSIQRAVIQRVLSPSTAAMGHSATNDLITRWAQAHGAASHVIEAARTAETRVFDILTPITMVQATLAVAEREPAPGMAATTQAPAADATARATQAVETQHSDEPK